MKMFVLPADVEYMVPPQAPRQRSFEVTQQVLGLRARLIAVAGELDMATLPTLRARLDEAADAGVRGLVIDLREVTFIDSVSIAAIVGVRRRLGEHARIAVVTHPESYAMLIFEVAGLESVVEIVHTRHEAVAHVEA